MHNVKQNANWRKCIYMWSTCKCTGMCSAHKPSLWFPLRKQSTLKGPMFSWIIFNSLHLVCSVDACFLRCTTLVGPIGQSILGSLTRRDLQARLPSSLIHFLKENVKVWTCFLVLLQGVAPMKTGRFSKRSHSFYIDVRGSWVSGAKVGFQFKLSTNAERCMKRYSSLHILL